MLQIFFIAFIFASSIVHPAEKASSTNVTIQFADNLALTMQKPFLHRFKKLHTISSHSNTSQPYIVTFDKTLTPELGIVLNTLITKPIAEIAFFNQKGNYSDYLFEASQLLGMREAKSTNANDPIAQFHRAFLEAAIRENAVTNWCVDARKKLIETKTLPTSHEQSPLNKLLLCMELVLDHNLAEQSSMIYETAYNSGFMHTLYTHMYGRVSRIIAQRPKIKCDDSISHDHVASVRDELFKSAAWRSYATLHGVCKTEEYDALLYGSHDTCFPTRHYHIALHDNIKDLRHEYDHAGKLLTPYEITTCYSMPQQPDGLRFKPMHYAAHGNTQPIFFTYFDAVLLQKLITIKKPTYLCYDLSGKNREVHIAPQAIDIFAKFPSALHINLGTLSPDNTTALEAQIEKHANTKKITLHEYSSDEYKQFHRSTPKNGFHQPIRLEKSVTTVTFFNTQNERAAQLIYATIDDTICCSCT